MYASLPIQDSWFSLNPLAGIAFITFGMLITDSLPQDSWFSLIPLAEITFGMLIGLVCVILCDYADTLYVRHDVRAIKLYLQQQHRVLVREKQAKEEAAEAAEKQAKKARAAG